MWLVTCSWKIPDASSPRGRRLDGPWKWGKDWSVGGGLPASFFPSTRTASGASTDMDTKRLAAVHEFEHGSWPADCRPCPILGNRFRKWRGQWNGFLGGLGPARPARERLPGRWAQPARGRNRPVAHGPPTPSEEARVTAWALAEGRGVLLWKAWRTPMRVGRWRVLRSPRKRLPRSTRDSCSRPGSSPIPASARWLSNASPTPKFSATN